LSVLSGPDQPWLNIRALPSKLDENLQEAMKQAGRAL
jgi:hypothetical protein